ncbi:MAG: Fic family protein [Sphingobacteriales bacterium]|nr:Fic family protein [Sphingobacteriales bacterium]
MYRDYPHLEFKKKWELTKRGLIAMGQCIALIKVFHNTPIMPHYYAELMGVALQKGAQSTTAIEGNTLSDEDIFNLLAGKKLPESIEYQGIEIRNIIDAFNELLKETIYENKEQLITPELLLRFHKMIGKNLGEHFAAIPGQFRNSDVIVGSYRCPDYRDVPELISKYCSFLREEFSYGDNNQLFSDIFIEAIVAHVYLEWIHPFGDGNGRTGRLLEFYILSRGGNPDITLHLLSNYYNATRPEYYRQIEKAHQERDLSGFIEYALIGFRDGLQQTLEKIQHSQLKMTWQKYVYEKFASVEIGQREVFKRKRKFALEMPIDKKFSLKEVPSLNIELAGLYSNINERTVLRDIEELVSLEILNKENGKYFANISSLNKMMAKRKGLLA